MDDLQLARWEAAFAAALAAEEEADLEPLWDEVSAAIAAEPDAAPLRRLRIRMAEACAHHASRHEDLLALRRIDPADRDAWLELAVLQHRWAFMLVPDDESDDAAEASDEPEAEDPDPSVSLNVRIPSSVGESADSPEGALEQEARGWLAQMIREHRVDADFCLQVFARWSDAGIYRPWLRLTLALETSAAHPVDVRFARELAEAWADLANQPPEGHDAENAKPPMGFMVDAEGTLWDPFQQERALALLAFVLARDPADTDLLERRARLLDARCDYPAASQAYATAHAAAHAQALAATDDEKREALSSRAAEMHERASLCAAGRGAITAAMYNGFTQAIDQMRQPLSTGEDASDAARGFAAAMQATLQQHAGQLDATLDAMRAAQARNAPDEAERKRLRALAQKIAGNVIGSVQLAPLQIEPIEPRAFEQDWAEALREERDAFAALGWRDLGWAGWPGYRAMLGHQAVSALWTDPRGETLAVAFRARGKLSLDLETEFEDGRLVVTAPCRGRNFLAGGPDVDTLFVEPELPIADLCALHAARVALALAQSPGAVVKRVRTVAEAAAMQEHGRQRKTAFRLAHGLTESEALGVPQDFPEVFAPLLREAVQAGLAPLRSASR